MSEYWDDPYGLDGDDVDDSYASEVLDDSYYTDEEMAHILGVAGPGDGFVSVGPHGESVQQMQANVAAQQQAIAEGTDPDDLPPVAEQGGAAQAADQVFENVFDNKGQIQFGEMVDESHGGGGGSAAIPSGPIGPSASASSTTSPGASKGIGAILLGVAAGVLFFLVKK